MNEEMINKNKIPTLMRVSSGVSHDVASGCQVGARGFKSGPASRADPGLSPADPGLSKEDPGLSVAVPGLRSTVDPDLDRMLPERERRLPERDRLPAKLALSGLVFQYSSS